MDGLHDSAEHRERLCRPFRRVRDETIEHHVGGRRSIAQRRRNPHERVPLLEHDGGVYGTQKRIEWTMGSCSIEPIQLHIGEVAEPRHKREAEQVAEPEELLGHAVRVRRVFARLEHRVVLEQPVEHVERLANLTRDGLRGKHGMLIGDVRDDVDRTVVVPEVPRIKRRVQRTLLHAPALAVAR
jgi:hypothetical protein